MNFFYVRLLFEFQSWERIGALYKLGQQIPVSIYILLFELQCSNKDNSELSHQDLRVHTDNKIKWVSLLICQIFSVSFP